MHESTQMPSTVSALCFTPKKKKINSCRLLMFLENSSIKDRASLFEGCALGYVTIKEQRLKQASMTCHIMFAKIPFKIYDFSQFFWVYLLNRNSKGPITRS